MSLKGTKTEKNLQDAFAVQKTLARCKWSPNRAKRGRPLHHNL